MEVSYNYDQTGRKDVKKYEKYDAPAKKAFWDFLTAMFPERYSEAHDLDEEAYRKCDVSTIDNECGRTQVDFELEVRSVIDSYISRLSRGLECDDIIIWDRKKYVLYHPKKGDLDFGAPFRAKGCLWTCDYFVLLNRKLTRGIMIPRQLIIRNWDNVETSRSFGRGASEPGIRIPASQILEAEGDYRCILIDLENSRAEYLGRESA
jgi:hypothetical protein